MNGVTHADKLDELVPPTLTFLITLHSPSQLEAFAAMTYNSIQNGIILYTFELYNTARAPVFHIATPWNNVDLHT